MANTAQKAILRAKINSVLTDLMIKTTGEQVFLDESTTLASKIAEMVADINARAKSTDVTTQINTAISGLINDAPETYDTLKEIADYISEHEDVVSTLNAAIGGKADKATVEAIQATINGLGSLATKNTISESDLSSELKTKVNTASTSSHSHTNKAVLDGITAAKVSAWDGKGESTIFYSATEPSNLTENDLWVQLVD